jgi:uncharacterized protein YgiM (DUF1202 family)
VSPSGSITPTPTEAKIIILQTPTGFLRVRSKPSTSETEVGRVTPGQTFTIIAEQDGWFEITLADKTDGWVSSDYAEKQ